VAEDENPSSLYDSRRVIDGEQAVTTVSQFQDS
jgi:hypothetical protein